MSAMNKKPVYDYDEILDVIGFGKYNICMLLTCCLLIMGMYLDIFGFSVMLPSVACDMDLSTTQQGLLSAIPLIGVMISSYAWGLCADTVGRRATLLIAMPIGGLFNLAAGLAPSFTLLAIVKFLSASFTSSANAAAFVLVGETTPLKHRSRAMFLMASATMLSQMVICVFALPVFQLTFSIEISWLSLQYVPWRLLMQIISLPGIIGVICVGFMHESPKFLLSKSRNDDAIKILRTMHRFNKGLEENYEEYTVYMEETQRLNDNKSVLRMIFNQTVPLFRPPLLKNSLILYYILLCAYMTSTGFTMWVPTMTNAYFNGDDTTGLTFCDVASKSASSNNTTTEDCSSIVKPMTLYATMCYSGVSAVCVFLLSFVVGLVGKKRLSIIIVSIATGAGILLLFIRIPVLSIILFFTFLYVAMVLGNINTYLVEVNPTHLRGMATCLSVVVARGFGFFSVQLIAKLLSDYCTPMVSGYVILVISGLIMAFFLPSDSKKADENNNTELKETYVVDANSNNL